jgi:hypothetical protein
MLKAGKSHKEKRRPAVYRTAGDAISRIKQNKRSQQIRDVYC